MAHTQKPDFVFRRNGRVHLNRRGRQFSRLLAAEVCASAVVMLNTPCSEVVGRVWPNTPFASFPFTSPPVRYRVPSHFKWTLLQIKYNFCFPSPYQLIIRQMSCYSALCNKILTASLNEQIRYSIMRFIHVYLCVCMCMYVYVFINTRTHTHIGFQLYDTALIPA